MYGQLRLEGLRGQCEDTDKAGDEKAWDKKAWDNGQS